MGGQYWTLKTPEIWLFWRADLQATLKVGEGDRQSALSSAQDYLYQLYQQHKRKISLWELVRQKLPAVTITASGMLYQAGK